MRQMLRSVRAFHEDEEGLEALQVVMIVAIGAVLLLAVIKLWNGVIKPWFTENTERVTRDMKAD